LRSVSPGSTAESRLPRPYLIGIAGGSNSGKTTITTRLSELMGAGRLSLIKLDSYYVESTSDDLEVRAAANYDHPDAFDWDLLNDHLAALAGGGSVEVPIYDYAIHDRSDRREIVPAARVVVVEGILVLWEPRLRERFDLKIFVDTPADLRIIRRLRRDVAERGRTIESILDQYLTTVRPSHELFIEPSKRYADVIVPEGGLNRPALEVLLARVRELANDAT
jgi:uridine kinase